MLLNKGKLDEHGPLFPLSDECWKKFGTKSSETRNSKSAGRGVGMLRHASSSHGSGSG